MAKRPVWMIIAHFYPVVGGAERQAQRVSRLLIAEHGLTVSVLTRRDSPRLPAGLPDREQIDGIPVIRLMSRAFLVEKMCSFSFMVSCLWHLFRHGRGDNYHAHDEGVSAWIAVIARFLFGGRAVLKMRGGRSAYERRTGIQRIVFLRLLRFADVVIAVNRDVQAMLGEWGIAADRIAYVPNGINADDFFPAADPNFIRDQLTLAREVVIVLFVGRLHRDKGTDTLLEAWRQLPERVRAGIQLLIVGDGPELTRLRQWTADSQIEQGVLFVGEKSNVRDYYQAADFLVQPAPTDGLSNTTLEAMACGLPVIAAGVEGALDLIDPGRSGLHFTPDRSDSLAQMLLQMMELKPQWKTMGDDARRTVLSLAELRRVASLISELYI